MTADESIAQSHSNMKAVSRFIEDQQVPDSIKEELKTYCNVSHIQKTKLSLTEQNEIYKDLPLSLKVEAARYISRDALETVEIFDKTRLVALRSY